MNARALIVIGVLMVSTGCTGQQRAGWQIGATLAEYQGQLLKIPNGPGAERLDIEMRYDPTVRHYVEQTSTPDYIYVETRTALQLMFIRDDRIVRFQRSALSPKSRAVVADGIPASLASMFSRADQARLAEVRRQTAGDAFSHNSQ